MKHRVSVIIPNFNRAEMLQQAIQSVLNQTYPILEILVCDDGSTDRSSDIVHQFTKERTPVVWLNCGKNGMPAIPRNMGVQQAKGEWIAFLDNDDFWENDKIEKQFQLIDSKTAKCISSNAHVLIAGTKQDNMLLQKLAEEIDCYSLLQENQIICSSVLIQKHLIEKAGYFPQSARLKAVEDYALWLKVSAHTNILTINEPLLFYRNDPTISIRASQKNEYKMKRNVLAHVTKYYLKHFYLRKALMSMMTYFKCAFLDIRYRYRMLKANA